MKLDDDWFISDISRVNFSGCTFGFRHSFIDNYEHSVFVKDCLMPALRQRPGRIQLCSVGRRQPLENIKKALKLIKANTDQDGSAGKAAIPLIDGNNSNTWYFQW